MTTYSSEILRTAAIYKLDPDLVAAVVLAESNGNAFAYRPEPRYRYLWDITRHVPFRMLSPLETADDVAPSDFPGGTPEWWAQRASWGLMQLMGAVARERGFAGSFLTELVNPLVNLGLGCHHLSDLLVWANGNTLQALAAYNGGKAGNAAMPYRNLPYANRVMDYYRSRLAT